MTYSIWHQRRCQDRRLDVAIIGGGISGLSAAYWLQKRAPSKRIAGFERGEIGSGASGRNAGFMTCGSIAHFDRQRTNLGLETALELWSMTTENHHLLAAEGLLNSACDYAKTGAFSLTRAPERVESLREAADLLRTHGAKVRHVSAGDAPLPDFAGGYWYEGDAQLDPIRLLEVLREASNVSWHQGTNVRAIRPTEDGVAVETDGGTYEATTVIVATNAYAPEWLPELGPWVRPVRAQALVTAPASRPLRAPVYALDDWAYLRQDVQGRIILGGFRPLAADEEVGTEDLLHPRVHAALDAFLARHCGDLFDEAPRVLRRWSGALGYAPDALPIVGELPDHPGCFFIGAHSGHGMGWAFVAAERLVALMLHGARPGPLDARRLPGRVRSPTPR